MKYLKLIFRKISQIQPHFITFLGNLFATLISLFIFYKAIGVNLNLEDKKSEEQVQVSKEVEPFKALLNSNLERLKSELQLEIIKETEPIKASIAKNNIAFQIHGEEYVKMRFHKINELFVAVSELHNFLKRLGTTSSRTYSGTEEEYQELIKKSIKAYEMIDLVNLKSFDASLYFDNPIRNKIEKYILKANSIISYDKQMYSAVYLNNSSIEKSNNNNTPNLVLDSDSPDWRKKIKKGDTSYIEIYGKKYLTIDVPSTKFSNILEYQMALANRYNKSNKELEEIFNQLEQQFKKQLESKEF